MWEVIIIMEILDKKQNTILFISILIASLKVFFFQLCVSTQ